MFKRRIGLGGFDVNLDPFMDILTATVGMVLFVVIFAVVESRGVYVKMLIPMLQSPPQGSQRKVMICQQGKIRCFDFDDSLEELIKGYKKLDYHAVPDFVKKANRKNIKDDNYSYKLEYDEVHLSFFQYNRSISVVINPIEGNSGESTKELEIDLKNLETGRTEMLTSKFASSAKEWSKLNLWVAFLIDRDSLEIFRIAREILRIHGIPSGWDPLTFSFPHKQCVLGCGESDQKGVGIGPQ